MTPDDTPHDDNKEETKNEGVTPDDTPHDYHKEETKNKVVTPDDTPHDNNKEETKNEVVTPDDNNNITPVDPNEMKEEEEGTPVIDITNDEVNGDIVTPKETISKPTPSLGMPDKKNEESSMDVPTALEYLAKVKAYMNRPKKIKEYIDHEMKMEEFLVEQFLDKSNVTKGPEIGLFVFLFSSLAYSVYVNLCGNCKSVIDAVWLKIAIKCRVQSEVCDCLRARTDRSGWWVGHTSSDSSGSQEIASKLLLIFDGGSMYYVSFWVTTFVNYNFSLRRFLVTYNSTKLYWSK